MDIYKHQFTLSLYKGENRILVIPIIDHIGGYSISSDWFINIKDFNEKTIGNSILEAFNYMFNVSPSILSPKERNEKCAWRKNTKYKTWNTFWQNNYYANVEQFEDGHYEIFSIKKSKTQKGGYEGIEKKIILPQYSTACEIGIAVIQIFKDLEEVDSEHQEVSFLNLELSDKSTMSFTIPKDIHFIDSQDSGSAEIYQCYSYIPKNGDKSIAELYLGMASELDCNLSPENIRNCWIEINGKTDKLEVKNVEYGIFHVRAEMKNKSVHKISYFLQITDNLLLECGMEVHQPNKRKKTDEKLSDLFEQFALSCKK